MLDHKDVKSMEEYLKQEDAVREEIIIRSRSILKNGKSAIYSIHRNELQEAKKHLDEATKTIKELNKILIKYPHLSNHMDNALEEYCEAAQFYGFINGKIPTSKEAGVDPITYLSALSDLTGELSRRTVLLAMDKKVKDIEKMRNLIDDIHGIFIKFNLRNGELRKKSDSIKWNLSKVEEILYNLKK